MNQYTHKQTNKLTVFLRVYSEVMLSISSMVYDETSSPDG